MVVRNVVLISPRVVLDSAAVEVEAAVVLVDQAEVESRLNEADVVLVCCEARTEVEAWTRAVVLVSREVVAVVAVASPIAAREVRAADVALSAVVDKSVGGGGTSSAMTSEFPCLVRYLLGVPPFEELWDAEAEVAIRNDDRRSSNVMELRDMSAQTYATQRRDCSTWKV